MVLFLVLSDYLVNQSHQNFKNLPTIHQITQTDTIFNLNNERMNKLVKY